VSFDQPTARVTRRVFPPGDHPVSVYACNNTGVCTQSQLTISVPQLADSAPPSMTCPGSSRQDGVDATGAPVSFAIPVATDDQDPSPAVGCDRVSGTVFPYGRTPVTCTATDASDNASQCSFEVEVVDLPPTLVLSGPAALSLECGDAFSEPGYAAADVRDGDLTSRVVVTQAIDMHRPGSYPVAYAVTDQSGSAAQTTRSVSIVDTIPPALSVSASPSVLWPPNHQLVPVALAVAAFDRCDPVPAIEPLSVTSSEPADNTGDGNTRPDIVAAIGAAATTVELRAGRKGNGSSRIYTVTYRARDTSTNHIEVATHVLVPHQGR